MSRNRAPVLVRSGTPFLRIVKFTCTLRIEASQNQSPARKQWVKSLSCGGGLQVSSQKLKSPCSLLFPQSVVACEGGSGQRREEEFVCRAADEKREVPECSSENSMPVCGVTLYMPVMTKGPVLAMQTWEGTAQKRKIRQRVLRNSMIPLLLRYEVSW